MLHVPYTYFPDVVGGTEIYVHGLVHGLAKRGFRSAVAAPGTDARTYEHDGIAVYRYGTSAQQSIAHAYGRTDNVALSEFEALLARSRPAVVHFHARTSAISVAMIEAACRHGARTVLTYHTPTMSCARGTMMLSGQSPCDGRLEARRCVTCALDGLGLPTALSGAVGRVPERIMLGLADTENLPTRLSAVRIPGLIVQAHENFRQAMLLCDRVVAVCDWVRRVLLINGVDPDKIVLSRQGIEPRDVVRRSERTGGQQGAAPRFAFFGRIDVTKGVDLIVEAFRLRPNLQMSCDLYLVRQPGSDAAFSKLSKDCARDRRLTIRDAVLSQEVRQTMTDYDMVIVPSRWLETGPLVALEALAAGCPVLGADLGGISELVKHDRTGVLFKAGDAAALAAALDKICTQPNAISRWQTGIMPVRTTASVTDDMAAIYATLLELPKEASSLRCETKGVGVTAHEEPVARNALSP